MDDDRSTNFQKLIKFCEETKLLGNHSLPMLFKIISVSPNYHIIKKVTERFAKVHILTGVNILDPKYIHILK